MNKCLLDWWIELNCWLKCDECRVNVSEYTYQSRVVVNGQQHNSIVHSSVTDRTEWDSWTDRGMKNDRTPNTRLVGYFPFTVALFQLFPFISTLLLNWILMCHYSITCVITCLLVSQMYSHPSSLYWYLLLVVSCLSVTLYTLEGKFSVIESNSDVAFFFNLLRCRWLNRKKKRWWDDLIVGAEGLNLVSIESAS